MCLDVSTGGELHVALAAGVPADRLVLHGNNKSDDELAAALAVGVGRIVVDSFDEIDRHRAAGADPPAGAGPTTPALGPRCWSGSPRASRSTPTSSSAPARTTPSSASALASGAAAPRRRPARRARRRRRRRVRGHPRPSGQPGLRPRARSPRPSRSWPGSSPRSACPSWWSAAASVSPTSTARRRRPWPQWADVGARGLPPGRHRRRRSGSPPSRAGRSWPRPASPSTGWGRSRTCPGTAPTCRSTAG